MLSERYPHCVLYRSNASILHYVVLMSARAAAQELLASGDPVPLKLVYYEELMASEGSRLLKADELKS